MINLSINNIFSEAQSQVSIIRNEQQKSTKMKTHLRKHRIFLTIILMLFFLSLLLVAASKLSNFSTSSSSQVVDHLDELQKACLTELLHLRRSLWNAQGFSIAVLTGFIVMITSYWFP